MKKLLFINLIIVLLAVFIGFSGFPFNRMSLFSFSQPRVSVSTKATSTSNSGNQQKPDDDGVVSGRATSEVTVTTVVNMDINQETQVYAEAEPESKIHVSVEEEVQSEPEQDIYSQLDRIYKMLGR